MHQPSRRSRHGYLILLLGVLLGCEQPFDDTPAGYASACYGTSEEPPLHQGDQAIARRNWVCSDQRMRIELDARREDWPDLKVVLGEFGRNHALRVFDVSFDDQHLDFELCSPDGLQIVLWDGPTNPKPDRVPLMLYTYKRDFPWKPLADELATTLTERWKQPVNVSWPRPMEEKERALPDSVASCDT
jgi:hypothetical protein